MEQWRIIEGFESHEVSNLGRVRNVRTGHKTLWVKYGNGQPIQLHLPFAKETA
jgi:hypothetical protein